MWQSFLWFTYSYIQDNFCFFIKSILNWQKISLSEVCIGNNPNSVNIYRYCLLSTYIFVMYQWFHKVFIIFTILHYTRLISIICIVVAKLICRYIFLKNKLLRFITIRDDHTFGMDASPVCSEPILNINRKSN